MLPLEGMRVIDLTRVLSGPYATMVLADLGADVVKLERFPGGDDARRLGPHENGESWCFASANRNKRSVALDLKSEEGQEVAVRLARDADVFIENFRPGVTARLGLDYDTLSKLNPGLIYCSITGFGQTGPYKNRPGYDIIAQGVGGYLRMTGQPDGRPAKVGIAIDDIAAGVTATQGILAAYIAKQRTGEGQYIDLSLVDSGLAWTVWESAAWFGSQEVPLPNGTRHRRNAPYQAYRTKDGYVTVGGNTEPLWQRFCTDVLERPDLIEDPRYADIHSRLTNVDDLEKDIESVFLENTTEHWVDRLDAAGVPGGPVLRYDETLENEHVLARGMVQHVEHPKLGTQPVLGSPLHMSGTPPQLRRPAPGLGEHSTEVLAAAGYSEQEIESLYASGTLYEEARDPDKEQA